MVLEVKMFENVDGRTPESLVYYSCMGICYGKLFEAAKSMFKSWDSRAVWTWLLLEKALTGPRFARMMVHWKAMRRAVTDHFTDSFVRKNVAHVNMMLWPRNDVRKFDDDAILFWEIKCKKRDI